MGAYFFRGERNSLLIRINGGQFNELANALRISGGKFKHNEKTISGTVEDKIWFVDEKNAYDAVLRLQSVESNIKMPSWVCPINLQNCVDKNNDKFEKYRASINPDLVKSEYKGDYQRKGILRGISQNRLAFYWEMGLGKTFVVQSVLNHLVYRGDVDKYIVVCPPEGILNFRDEILKFNSFDLKEEEIYVCSVYNRKPFEDLKYKVILMTYQNLIMLHNDYYKQHHGERAIGKRIIKNYIPFGMLGSKLAIVCDESAEFKNPKSRTWKVLNKMRDFFPYRYILTGTPAPKYAADLWTQMRFLHSSSVPDEYETFISRIADVGNQWSAYAVNSYHEDKVNKFLEDTAYLVSREKMLGNIDLPELIMDTTLCVLPPKQEELYQSVVNYELYTLREQNGVIYPSKLRSKFMLLCMALHDPKLLAMGSLAKVPELNRSVIKKAEKWDIQDNGKWDVAASLLEKYIIDQKKKVILWSAHPYIIDTLYEKFKKFKPIKIHGGIEMEKGESVAGRNARICNEFLSSGCPLLIANHSVLKTSVNLTAVTRNIYWDLPMEQDVLFQTIKRSHRIGTTEPVITNFLLFPGTIEENLYYGILDKNEFNERAWAKNQPMTVVDLKRLFNGRTVRQGKFTS
jgi:SNF2 family DNA or RNA helicase